MEENGINGLEPDAIAQELSILIDAYIDNIPDGKNGAVSDAIYETIRANIETLAFNLSNVTSIGDAERIVEDTMGEAALEAAKAVDPNFPEEKIYNYIARIVGEVEGIMLGLGFSVENIDEDAL